MKKDRVLAVIDMQNAYLEGNPFACKNMPEVISKIIGLIENNHFDKIIYYTRKSNW